MSRGPLWWRTYYQKNRVRMIKTNRIYYYRHRVEIRVAQKMGTTIKKARVLIKQGKMGTFIKKVNERRDKKIAELVSKHKGGYQGTWMKK